jgi:hypothetical protein
VPTRRKRESLSHISVIKQKTKLPPCEHDLSAAISEPDGQGNFRAHWPITSSGGQSKTR